MDILCTQSTSTQRLENEASSFPLFFTWGGDGEEAFGIYCVHSSVVWGPGILVGAVREGRNDSEAGIRCFLYLTTTITTSTATWNLGTFIR